MGLNLRSVASEWVERPPLAARHRRSAPKRLVRLSRRPPAACFGVNKPRLCCSACSPEGKKPRLQLEVLIKAFRGDYVAVCQGFVPWKWLGSDSNAWKPASKPRLCPNLYKREYLISCILSTFKDFGGIAIYPSLQNTANICFHDTLIKRAASSLVGAHRKIAAAGLMLIYECGQETRTRGSFFFGILVRIKNRKTQKQLKKKPKTVSAPNIKHPTNFRRENQVINPLINHSH